MVGSVLAQLFSLNVIAGWDLFSTALLLANHICWVRSVWHSSPCENVWVLGGMWFDTALLAKRVRLWWDLYGTALLFERVCWVGYGWHSSPCELILRVGSV